MLLLENRRKMQEVCRLQTRHELRPMGVDIIPTSASEDRQRDWRECLGLAGVCAVSFWRTQSWTET